MPRIMCPNCGTPINLENRRETDFDMIKNAAERKARTFTELLHITNLSRKTLSLRLKEMCQNGILVKSEGTYNLNGGFPSEEASRKPAGGFRRAFNDKRIRIGLMLVALILFSSASSYVLASFLMPKATYHEPVALGTFTLALDVSNVENLYSWQVAVRFNSSEVKVQEIMSRDFVGYDPDTGFPLFMNFTDTRMDYPTLLLGGTLLGDVQGKDGTGRLATIGFVYFVKDFAKPEIMFNEKTFLLDPDGASIPIGDSTLTLRTIRKE